MVYSYNSLCPTTKEPTIEKYFMTEKNVYNSVKWKGAGMTLVAEKIRLHLKHECASRTRVRKLPSTSFTAYDRGTSIDVFSIYSFWAPTYVLGSSADKLWPL